MPHENKDAANLITAEGLRKLNEELTALNTQLQETVEQHRATSNDLQNILDSSDVATLFLDGNLNIRFFTPATTSLFRVISSDVLPGETTSTTNCGTSLSTPCGSTSRPRTARKRAC